MERMKFPILMAMRIGFPHRTGTQAVAALVLAAALAGCGHMPDRQFEGLYVPGLPNFDLHAVAVWRDGRPGIEVTASIPNASLVFVLRDNAFHAEYEVVITVYDNKGVEFVAESSWVGEMTVPTYEETQQLDPSQLRQRMEVSPGVYRLVTKITDRYTEKSALRGQVVEVYRVEDDRLAVGRVRIATSERAGGYRDVPTLHVPGNFDSLRFTIAAYNVREEAQVTAALRLIRFRHDSLHARAPYSFSPMMGSLEYTGVDFRVQDTLLVLNRSVQGAGEEMTIDFTAGRLPRGVYRAEVSVHKEGNDAPLREERLFTVLSENFPRPSTIETMVEALVYIAKPEEMDSLRAAGTPEEMRRRFEEFWLEFGRNRASAADLIRHYYSRVEQANRMFTTHKEGWKTDRGMVFIVLGSPVLKEARIDMEVWRYSYADRDLVNLFVFRRNYSSDDRTSFENHILTRQAYYDYGWGRAIERWRRGFPF
jgi:GWxTD domain-containing protein